MAQIDTSKIEGYAEMTPEQKVAALEAFSMPDPDYSGYVKKDVFDKKASEAAKLEKDLKARMSEEEIRQKETAEELNRYKAEAEALKREKTISENKAKFISLGYDDALASETAEAMANGDMATVFKNHQIVIENVKKIAKGEAMANTTPPAGKATDGSKTITKEQFKAMSVAERTELYQTNRELYDELSK